MIFAISFVKRNCQEICPSKQASINIHTVSQKPVRGFLKLLTTDVLYLWVTFKPKPEKSHGNLFSLVSSFIFLVSIGTGTASLGKLTICRCLY